MSDVTQQIKEKLDIAEFIKNYVQLLPAGKNFKACCPFHKEKTPSFMVSSERQSWHCFGGCNDGGDIFSFLMKYENLEFYEALQILAEKAGVDLKRTAGSHSEHKQYNTLYEINNAAKNFFQKNLISFADDAAKAAVNYCLDRGLKKETMLEFELGLAPNVSDQLLRYLLNLGFSAPEIEKAGLVFRTERGTYWDRFRGRLMFPIYNSFSKIVGFTGRILPNAARPELVEGQAKYINSPETPIFNKSKILYGLHKAKEAIRDQQFTILVEGQMDFLMTYQSGIKNVVATSGTALTTDHLKLLRRLTDQLTLSFDSDEAGLNAAERSVDLALASDFSVKILVLPGKDPADIAKNNPDQLRQLLSTTKTAREFYFDRYLKNLSDPYQLKKGVRFLLAKTKNLYSQLDQADWIKNLSNRTGLDEKSLLIEMEKLTAHKSLLVSQNKTAPASTEMGAARKQLIAQRILDLGGPKEILETYAPEIFKDKSNFLALQASLENSQLSADATEKEIEELIRQLKIEFYKEKVTVLKNFIAQAERGGRKEALADILKEFDSYSRELHNIIHHGHKTS